MKSLMFDIFFTVRLEELIHGNNTTYIILYNFQLA